jgi:hypothetical protein
MADCNVLRSNRIIINGENSSVEVEAAENFQENVEPILEQ